MNLLFNHVSSEIVGVARISQRIQQKQIVTSNTTRFTISNFINGQKITHNKIRLLRKYLSSEARNTSSKNVFWDPLRRKSNKIEIFHFIPSFSPKRIRKFSSFTNRNKSYCFSNNTRPQTIQINENAAFHNNNAILLLSSFFGRGDQDSTQQEGFIKNSGYFISTPNFNNKSKSVIGQTKKGEIKNSENIAYLIRKPSFSHTNHKVTIQLFYYMGISNDTLYNANFTKRIAPKNFLVENKKSTLTSLSTYLAQLYKKEVSLVIIRLHYPFLDSYILAQYLAHNASNNTFIQFQETIFTNAAKAFHSSDLPSHITGIKVQISGRLITESVIPRITVKSSLIGSFSQSESSKEESIHQIKNKSSTDITTHRKNNSSKTRQVIDYSRYTHKNNLGSFTIKVWIASRQQSHL